MNRARDRKGRQVLFSIILAGVLVSGLFGKPEKVQADAFTVNSLGDTGAGSVTAKLIPRQKIDSGPAGSLEQKTIVNVYSARRNSLYEKAQNKPSRFNIINRRFHTCNQCASRSDYESDDARAGTIPAAQK